MLAIKLGIMLEPADIVNFPSQVTHALLPACAAWLCCCARLPCLQALILEATCAVSRCTEVVVHHEVGFQHINLWLFAHQYMALY